MSGGDDIDDAPDPRTVAALADTERMTGAACRACGAMLCGHDAVFSLVLGYKNLPRCTGCIAAHMQEPVAALRERTLDYVRHHDCFLAAWRHAGEQEGTGRVERPPCVWNVREPSAPAAADPGGHDGERSTARDEDHGWDAGGMGCGDLLLELRQRLRALPAGAVFELRATDSGAPIDLPAWCKLTGHTMLSAEHPTYRIRRRS